MTKTMTFNLALQPDNGMSITNQSLVNDRDVCIDRRDVPARTIVIGLNIGQLKPLTSGCVNPGMTIMFFHEVSFLRALLAIQTSEKGHNDRALMRAL